MNNLIRLSALCIYPIILFIILTNIYHNDKYKQTIRKKWKIIVFNSLIIFFISIVAIYIFFKLENTIYSFDYAGHWLRSLELRNIFFEKPGDLLKIVYNSMNNYDYNYLANLFLLPFTIINVSYSFMGIGSFCLFILPTFILLEIIFYSYTNKYKYLPIFIYLILYPVYFGLFFGEIDSSALLFISYSIVTLFTKSLDDIDFFDILTINLSSFLILFLRRYYLYYIFVMYILFLIKTIIQIYKQHDKLLTYLLKAILTGIIALLILLIFFFPYVNNILNNNFSEAYSMYDRNNKLSAFINYLSPITIFISVCGIVANKNKALTKYLVILIIFIPMIFWQTQAFEYHHYNLVIIPIIILFTFGLITSFNINKIIGYLLVIILLLQSVNIFTNNISTSIPLLTTIRKQPEEFWDLDGYKELSHYLSALTSGEGQTIFMATGNTIFNYDLISNANLPDISSRPVFETVTFDIRDGFPKDFQQISYIVTSDPIHYLYPDNQHIFEIITKAITTVPMIKDIYKPIKEFKIDFFKVTIYEKTGDFTPEIKNYFYQEMIKIYPDKKEFFSYILD